MLCENMTIEGNFVKNDPFVENIVKCNSAIVLVESVIMIWNLPTAVSRSQGSTSSRMGSVLPAEKVSVMISDDIVCYREMSCSVS